MSFDWKSLIRTVAPTIATAIGGPLAGMATAEVSKALLGKPDGTEEEMAVAAAGASADIIKQLRQAEIDFKVKLKELGIREQEIAAADMSNAREREIKTGDRTTRNLAYIIVFSFIIIIGAQLVIAVHPVWEISADVQRTLDISFGILFTAFTGVMAYYFGSSVGDVHKDKTLRSIASRE